MDWFVVLAVTTWVGAVGVFSWSVMQLRQSCRNLRSELASCRDIAEQNAYQIEQLSTHAEEAAKAQLEDLFEGVDLEELTQNIMDFDVMVFDAIRSVSEVYLSFPVYKISYEGRPHIIIKSKASPFCLDLLDGPLNNIWVETLIALSKIAYLAMKADQKEMLEEYLCRKLPFEYAYIALGISAFFELNYQKGQTNIVDLMNDFFTDERLYMAA